MPAALLLAAGMAIAAEPTFIPGAKVDWEALRAADWIQGNGPDSSEAGGIQIFECWATWCGGCVAHIPRLEEIHRKFRDKGLRVYGIDVWEDDKNKVLKFVRAKGEGMSYPVAFTGKGSAFDRNWLNAARQRSIPHAFVVKDGKLVFGCSPHYLTDEVLSGLLDPATFERTVGGISAVATSRDRFANTSFEFEMAERAGNVAAMEESLAVCEKFKPNESAVIPLRLKLCFVKRDWQQALKELDGMPHGKARNVQLRRIALRLVWQRAGETPAEFTVAFAKTLAEAMQSPEFQPDAEEWIHLSTLQWRNGALDQALSAVARAVEAAKGDPQQAKALTAFEKFSASLDSGVLPEMKQFKAWTKEVPDPSTNTQTHTDSQS